MCENKQEFDPRDLNHDGKVSFDEKLKDAANKTGAALKNAAGAVVDGTKEVAGKVKDYVDMTPEERKIKNAEIKDKVSDAANKAANAAKGAFEDVKEGAEKLFKKGEETA